VSHESDAAAKAAAAIVESHRDELARFLGAMVGQACAADIVQECWLRLSRVWANEQVTHPKALLFRIGANLARDELRRRKRQGGLLEASRPAEEPRAPATEDKILLDEQLDQVRLAIDGLPPKCRRVFLLKRLEGNSYREIARSEGISEKTVENQMTRALKLIRQRLETS
jgi:RNA polymerase sigma-70 factor (ECF subfamily)